MWVGLQELSEDGQTGMKRVYTVVRPKCFIFTASDPHIGCSHKTEDSLKLLSTTSFPSYFTQFSFETNCFVKIPVFKRLERAKEKTLCMLKTVKDHPAHLTTECTALPSSTGASLTKH